VKRKERKENTPVLRSTTSATGKKLRARGVRGVRMKKVKSSDSIRGRGKFRGR